MGVDLSTPVNQLIVMRKEIVLVSKLQNKFSRQADHTSSEHVPCHQTDVLLCLWLGIPGPG